MDVAVADNVETAADRLRPRLALYIGGMGARELNYHYRVFARLGFESACEQVQELYLAGRKEDAARAVPIELVERVALVGPPAKIARELDAWRGSLLTTMLLRPEPETLRFMAGLLG